jgi:hypothetical protein
VRLWWTSRARCSSLADDPELRTALEAAAQMFGYVNGDHDSLPWNDAVDLVPGPFTAQTSMVLGTFIDDKNVDNLILVIKNYYDELKTP